MSVASLCKTHRVALQTPQESRDSSGGIARTWETTTDKDDLHCTIQPLSAHVRFQYAQRQVYISHRVYMARDCGAKKHDRFYDSVNEKIYLITGISDEAGRGKVFSWDVNEQLK